MRCPVSNTNETTILALSEAQKATLARQIAKEQKAMEARKAAIAQQYPHADVETLEFDASTKKYRVQIKCSRCGELTWKYTSDLHQSTTCPTCRPEEVKDRREAKKVAEKEVKDLLKKYGSAKAVMANLTQE
jgi:formylmethanofuran dehydrogenase subunit E